MRKLLEEQISTLLKKRKKEAITLLYQHHSDDLYGLILKIIPKPLIAQEALQDCFINIWKEGQNYDTSKDSLCSWLASIARNTALKKVHTISLKNKTKEKDLEKCSQLENIDSIQLIDDIQIQNVIDSLDEQHKKFIELAYFKGFSQSEIQQKLNIPLCEVQSKTKLAFQELQNKLEPHSTLIRSNSRRKDSAFLLEIRKVISESCSTG